MDWIVFVIAIVVFIAFYGLKWLSFVSPETARKNLASGALVVDVRTAREFTSGHLPGAINIPLGELRATVRQKVPDKNQPLLLHCLSGGRSAIAVRQLRGLGYASVFNLGSYSRAEHILAQK